MHLPLEELSDPGFFEGSFTVDLSFGIFLFQAFLKNLLQFIFQIFDCFGPYLVEIYINL